MHGAFQPDALRARAGTRDKFHSRAAVQFICPNVKDVLSQALFAECALVNLLVADSNLKRSFCFGRQISDIADKSNAAIFLGDPSIRVRGTSRRFR